MIALLLAWTLALAAPAAPDTGNVLDQAPLFVVVPDPGAGWRPLVRIGRILDDADLEQAARSGFPLRLRCRVELWRDGRFVDALAGAQDWSAVIVFQPLDSTFLVRESATGRVRRFASYAAATAELEQAYPLPLHPTRRGRYYYTARLDVETVSVSDLQELEHWLRGELGPAVSGDGSIPSAVEQGVKRLFVRVLGLPALRHEARSGKFTVR
ncbi:MAG: DUF4390 domain-containing protein [Gemmatimonadetes bacterium]|nr:DUF4390 domain-containing protein [Gemmatimonadota bacterium]